MSTYRIERDRGIKEYPQQLTELRQKWPLAFPAYDEDVRPLAIDATDEIAAVMGWSHPFTLGVLSRWKMAPLYCQAVLKHPQRIALDGSPGEIVDPKARDLATKHLARRAAKSKFASSPSLATPRETPEHLRDRVRASLLRRRA
jgi:sRNA-binding protein